MVFPAKPHRRWFRFSLRALFLLLTAVAVASGWKFNELRRRSQAIMAIKRPGVAVMFEHDFAGQKHVPNAKPPGWSPLKKLLGEYYSSRVRQIEVYVPSAFTDREAEAAAILTELDWLAINSSPVTDEGLKHLMTLKNLGRMDLEGAHVSARAVQQLCRALPHTRIYSDFDYLGMPFPPYKPPPE